MFAQKIADVIFLISTGIAGILAALWIYQFVATVISKERTRRKLKESEEKHRFLLNSINSPAVGISREFEIIYCNEKFADLFGVNRREIVGQNLLKSVPGFRDSAFYPIFSKALDTEESFEEVVEMREKVMKTQVYRSPAGILAIADDISDLVETEKELRERVHDLRRSMKLMSGREVRMIELKRKINELLLELGREKKYSVPDQVEEEMGGDSSGMANFE